MSLVILRECGFGTEREAGARGEGGRREVPGEEFRPGGGGDHGGVVRGERERGKGDGQAALACCPSEAGAEFAVCGHAAGDEQAVCAVVLGGGEGLAAEIVDDSALEGGEEIECLLVAEREGVGGFGGCGDLLAAGGDGCGHRVRFDVAEDRGLDAAEAEEEGSVGSSLAAAMDFWLDLGEGERDRVRVAVGGEVVDPGAAGIAEAEQLGDLVEGLAGGVVDGVADVAVVPGVVVMFG